MTAKDKPPSPEELQAMAYVDGELPPDDARRFEARLAESPALAREVTELRALELMARRMAPPEPMDWEWQRLERDPLHVGGHRLGLGLALAGLVGFCAWLLYLVITSDQLPLLLKVLLLSLGGGTGILFLAVLRARLRTRPFDPYTKVKR